MSLIKFDRTFLRKEGFAGLIGIDEAGRGSLVGSVVAGCVWLRAAFYENARKQRFSVNIKRIKDSKQLQIKEREQLYTLFEEWQDAGVLVMTSAEASVEEIETLNISGATGLAMKRALQKLIGRMPKKHHAAFQVGMPLWDNTLDKSELTQILVDGRPQKDLQYAHEAIIGGDNKSLIIAMGSIVAKVTRDRKIIKLDAKHPGYGLKNNKGYGTIFHRKAIKSKGPLPIHRRLFLRKIL